MKKLMIVAAVAAMAGAAVAEEGAVKEYVYDFTASVKSTGGKQGKDITTTYTVNLGRDATGTWWWQTAGYSNSVVAKASVKAAEKACNNAKDWTELEDLADLMGFNYKTGKEAATDYNVKDQNGKWCTTFKFKVITPAVCYRVAKSYKLKDQVVGECCGDWEGVDTEISFADGFIQRFGSQAINKANKVEILAAVAGYDEKAFNYTADIAGQGTWKDGIVDSVSGNIVGKKDAPTCWECCEDDVDAFAFECDAEEDADMDDTLDTALFGTFKLKYNKKATAELK